MMQTTCLLFIKIFNLIGDPREVFIGKICICEQPTTILYDQHLTLFLIQQCLCRILDKIKRRRKSIDYMINYLKYASKSIKCKRYALKTNKTQNMHLYAQ
uniref:Uncharacterized protein n=1 Tax=Sipha flava TaxID=143950 RepID=A0A2S2R0U2_9HEMI